MIIVQKYHTYSMDVQPICNNYAIEDVEHLVLHCPDHDGTSNTMIAGIQKLHPETFYKGPDMLSVILVNQICILPENTVYGFNF